jgi:hypothetical protein
MCHGRVVDATPSAAGKYGRPEHSAPASEFVAWGADKFIGSGLEMRLKDKGIKTAIVTGISAQGAALGTSKAPCGAVTRPSRRLTNVGGRPLQ